jgi:hypothetical protein
VVPSIIPSLTACRSIAFIKECKMEQNCILALTMMDRLHYDMIDDYLIKHLVNNMLLIIMVSQIYQLLYLCRLLIDMVKTDNFCGYKVGQTILCCTKNAQPTI